MTTSQGWEVRLLSLASEARRVESHRVQAPMTVGSELRPAYAKCEAITAASSPSFHLATSLLPPAKRQAIRALYAVCRVSDNIVDRKNGDAPALLRDWRRRVLAPDCPAGDPVLRAWHDVRLRYAVPRRYMEQLLYGVAQDLCPRRLATFDEMAAYAYGVASTVGLMSMHVLGYSSEAAVSYAIKLGVALQLTNILRDIGEDWRAGRLYVPLADLEQFDLSLRDVAAGQVSDRWRALMRFQIERNRRLYAEAWPGIGLLHPDGRLAVAAAADLYRAILDDIEAHDYDVFTRRAHVGTLRKLMRLPSIGLRSRSQCRPTIS
jgi:15-cis-phytoene synthase